MTCTRLRSDGGFTLIETLVAALVLVVGVLGTLKLIDNANAATASTREREAATNLARELVEAARGVRYEKLHSANVLTELQSRPGLEDTPVGGPYTIERRGGIYTVDAAVCVMDDPKDLGGNHAAGSTFCADSAVAGALATNIDRNPEDYKRVTVTVRWTSRSGVDRNVTQTGVINNPGSASGPAVRTLVPDAGGTPPYRITDGGVTTLTFKLTTSSEPFTTTWMLDGRVQQPNPQPLDATGLTHGFDWEIAGVVDGAYTVSAKAYDEYGVSGPGRSETVILNRFKPEAPRDFAGGRSNFGTVEMEWTANVERDIIGYKVDRLDAGTWTLVCGLRLETSCTDPAPPNADQVEYRVRAFDRDQWNAERESDPTALTVSKGNRPPPPPVLVSYDPATATLTWQRPSTPDPDFELNGDQVAFYRIYRDGQALANRYARWFTDGELVSWQDPSPGTGGHTYWLTAVDENYAESTFVGPIG